jgi:hypothetical protein
LRHLSERLKQLQEEDEIKQGNETLKKDLVENSEKALELAQNLDEGKTENISDEDIKMIKSALGIYKKDLSDSTEWLKNKLGTELSIKNVNSEIALIDNNLKHRNWY